MRSLTTLCQVPRLDDEGKQLLSGFKGVYVNSLAYVGLK